MAYMHASFDSEQNQHMQRRPWKCVGADSSAKPAAFQNVVFSMSIIGPSCRDCLTNTSLCLPHSVHAEYQVQSEESPRLLSSLNKATVRHEACCPPSQSHPQLSHPLGKQKPSISPPCCSEMRSASCLCERCVITHCTSPWSAGMAPSPPRPSRTRHYVRSRSTMHSKHPV